MRSTLNRLVVLMGAVLLFVMPALPTHAQQVIKQSTSAQSLLFGPVCQSSDHTTAITGLVPGPTITSTAATTTTTVTSVTSLAVGQYIKFAAGTTTVALQNQSTWVTVAGLTATLSPALPAAPAIGDTFTASNLIVLISKNGSTFAPPVGALTEAGRGFYVLAANATDSNTLGFTLIGWTVLGATAGDPNEIPKMIVSYDPLDPAGLGLTSVATTLTQATGLTAALVPYTSTVNDALSTTTVIDTAITGTADLTGNKVVFTNGALKGVYRTIASMNTGTGAITLLSALSAAPANGVGISIVQGSKALEQMLAALGTDSRVKISTDVHSSGVSIAGITGTTLPAVIPAFPTNFGAFAISAGAGAVTIGGYVTGQDPATLLFAASYTTIPANHTIPGTTPVTLTYKQLQVLTAAINIADNTSNPPVASSTAVYSYYLPGQPKVAGNLIYQATVTYDANKQQASKVILIAQPFPAIP